MTSQSGSDDPGKGGPAKERPHATPETRSTSLKEALAALGQGDDKESQSPHNEAAPSV